MILVTLFVLLGVSSVFSQGLYIVGIALGQSPTNNAVFVVGIIIIHMQGLALFVFQGVRLREIQQLWYKWIQPLICHRQCCHTQTDRQTGTHMNQLPYASEAPPTEA